MSKMTIKDFARELGVSPTTVSRAISGKGAIGEATRQRVLDRMKEFGYVPNLHAQQIVTGKSQMVLLHHTQEEILSDLFLIEMARGIQEGLRLHEYGLLLDTDSNVEKGTSFLKRWVNAGAVDGAILVKDTKPFRDQIQNMVKPGCPFVVVGDPSVFGLPYVGLVMWDTQKSNEAIAEMLAEYGHRRIAFISHWSPDSILSSFQESLHRKGLGIPQEMLIQADMSQQGGALALRKLMAIPTPPTAIIARKDIVAVGVVKEARSMGIHVPEDLSVIGWDDSVFSEITNPTLTTVRMDSYELGRTAVEQLFRLLDNPYSQPLTRVVETELIVRESVGQAKST